MKKRPSRDRVVNLGDVAVQVGGRGSERRTTVEAFFRGAGDHPGPPAARLRFQAGGPPVPDRRPDEDTEFRRMWYEGDRLVVLDPTGVSAVVTPEDGVIGGPTDHPDVAFRRIFLPVAAHLLAHHRRFVVHGAAVSSGGDAWLALGTTGTGKSTLGLAALSAGWELLGDDLVIVRDVTGAVEVSGIPRPPAVPDLGDHWSATGSPIPDDPRRRRELEPSGLRQGWVRVAGTILMDHSPAREGFVEPIHGAEILIMIVGSFSPAGHPELLRRCYPLAARLARLPSWRLGLASDESRRLRDAVRQLEHISSHR